MGNERMMGSGEWAKAEKWKSGKRTDKEQSKAALRKTVKSLINWTKHSSVRREGSGKDWPLQITSGSSGKAGEKLTKSSKWATNFYIAMMTTSGQWRGKGRVGKLLWEKLWQLAPFVSVCFPRLTGEKFAPFLLFPRTLRFPAFPLAVFWLLSSSRAASGATMMMQDKRRAEGARSAEEQKK